MTNTHYDFINLVHLISKNSTIRELASAASREPDWRHDQESQPQDPGAPDHAFIIDIGGNGFTTRKEANQNSLHPDH